MRPGVALVIVLSYYIVYIFYSSMYFLRQVREFSLGVPLRDELVALPFQLV